MNATTILEELCSRYESFASYVDEGRVTLKFPNSGNREMNEIKFRTFFQRPDSFRFEWTSHHPYPPLKRIITHRILYSQRGNTLLFDSRSGTVRKEESLELGIAGATGVSCGAALTVANLLLPHLGAFAFTSLESLAATEILLEGKPSIWVKGTHPMGDLYELWITKTNGILQRLIETSPDGTISEEVRERITVNEPVSGEIFTTKAVCPPFWGGEALQDDSSQKLGDVL